VNCTSGVLRQLLRLVSKIFALRSDDEKSEFLKSLAEAYTAAGHPESAYIYLLMRLRYIPAASASAEPASLGAIAAALRLPGNFSFEELLQSDAVQSAKEHKLFALLKIFLAGSLADYLSWESSNQDVLKEFTLDTSSLQKKIRLLALASLCSHNIGQDLSYASISSALQVETDRVEYWVIEGIRSKLIFGKLSQPNESFYVTRSTTRAFEKEQWETLERRLLVWKASLADVLDVVNAAKEAAGGVTLGGSSSIPVEAR